MVFQAKHYTVWSINFHISFKKGRDSLRKQSQVEPSTQFSIIFVTFPFKAVKERENANGVCLCGFRTRLPGTLRVHN